MVQMYRCKLSIGFRKYVGASKATNFKKCLIKGLWQMLLKCCFFFFFSMCFLVVLLPVTQQNISCVIVGAVISVHFQNSCLSPGCSLGAKMLPRDEFFSEDFGFSYLPLDLAAWYLLIRSLYWSVAWIGMRLQLMLPVKICDSTPLRV